MTVWEAGEVVGAGWLIGCRVDPRVKPEDDGGEGGSEGA
jgi:hypothetical protein